ncbi:serine hydrolase domain-containing protein [Crossiella cryophila]|uniref:CubicO group peptidase (Beta-lactamase class C family) n=1 Tax=Crossiella cryophila TaxID=43355 RepID=A0A7W7CJW3_9PSEU|nr:serine hydrolase domain-containing protein [Crossiella cryophila]MBB4680824.1 CubicO group peptidase (beta-lactamase class C family) [Crossiella cryophila]
MHGTVAAGYESVGAEFAKVVAGERADYAGQLVAYVRGEKVVDLWSGPGFTADTLTGVFSATKGAMSLVVALLVQDGVLDPDQRVSHYWPEFAAQGKRDITLREVLAHRAGVVGADAGFSLAELADDRLIAARMADQRPYWRPGTAYGYHAWVIGALAGEVVRRVTGQSIQELFEERIRAPYGLDFHLGLPEELEPRFVTTLPMLPTPEQQAEIDDWDSGPESLAAIAFNTHRTDAPELWDFPNQRIVRAQGQASAGGVASARGLAGMYAAASTGFDGRPPLLKPDTMAEFAQIQSIGYDVVSRVHKAFGLGFSAVTEFYPFLGQGAFGHSGAAGSLSLADPRSGLAYGYNRRRYAYPGGAAAENTDLLRTCVEAARTTH